MSMVSSAAIKFIIGLYQLAPTDAYRSHSDMPQQGGSHGRSRTNLMSYDGVKRLLAGKKQE